MGRQTPLAVSQMLCATVANAVCDFANAICDVAKVVFRFSNVYGPTIVMVIIVLIIVNLLLRLL